MTFTPPCPARRCRHCRSGDHVRPLTPADLAWFFGEAESALGIRSTHGSFIDMALIGPPSHNGGRSNGAEAAMLRKLKMSDDKGIDAIGWHRCIRARLEQSGATAFDINVLRAALSPEDWVRAITDPVVRGDVEVALRAVPSEIAKLLPLTEAAQAHAARRQAPATASAEPVIVAGGWDTDPDGETFHAGVRCAYRPAPAPPKSRKARASDPGRKPPETPAERLKRHLREQPGLAGSARGYVMQLALGEDAASFRGLVRAAADLYANARAAVGVRDQPRPTRVRAHRALPDPAQPLFPSELA